MRLCLIYCSEKSLKNEIVRVFSKLSGIETRFLSDPEELCGSLRALAPFMVLVTEGKNLKSFPFHTIHECFPQIYMVYYSSVLNLNASRYADFIQFNHIIAGDNREESLKVILNDLITNSWKKIPYDKFGFAYENLSTRMKKVMNFIESQDLKDCLTAKIARDLEISQGYLSQEFKKETGLSFRLFMQKLMDHYEDIIFEHLKLSAKAASKLLGYSELSSFSRSFKKRKGYPPSHQKIHKSYP
jgi:YesN/AraC family two-component response regulator